MLFLWRIRSRIAENDHWLVRVQLYVDERKFYKAVIFLDDKGGPVHPAGGEGAFFRICAFHCYRLEKIVGAGGLQCAASDREAVCFLSDVKVECIKRR